MQKLINELKDYLNGLKLKQRMLLVYIVGCCIPLLFVVVYIYRSTRELVLNQELWNEEQRLSEDISQLDSIMKEIDELSKDFYYDASEKKLVLKTYDQKIVVDYRNFSELSSYLENAYPRISDVCVYVRDDSVVDNRHFKYITDTISQKNWYFNTMNKNGNSYWSYITNVQTGKKTLRITRRISTISGQYKGIISISLDEKISRSISERKDVWAFLAFHNGEIIYDNFGVDDEDYSSIREKISENNKWITLNGKKCLVIYDTLDEKNRDEYFNLVVLKPYDEISLMVNLIVLKGLIPLIIGILIAALALTGLSNWFSKRIERFGKRMHDTAAGNLESKELFVDNVKDEIWELSLDLNQMVDDIRMLSEKAMEERIQKEQLYSRQRDVEFKMLATQINPHFLYNTLENIRMLARMNDQPDIEDMSVALTKILRKSLNSGSELKTLSWEMEMIESYVSIQNYRFGDRIKTIIDYDKALAEKYYVPPLIVQPFVENAYVHAMEDKECDGIINVKVVIEDKLLLYIEDNGHGMSKEQLEEITRYINDFDRLDRTHIGICNVNQRIKLVFGNEYGVDFESEENVGTKVKITMPLVEHA